MAKYGYDFFEERGVQKQLTSKSLVEAEDEFKMSCNACCASMRCLYHKCDHCPIKGYHENMVAILKDRGEETNE